MRKFASIIFLVSAMTLPAFAGGQDQGPGKGDEDQEPGTYVCWAQDYEHLWYQGYPAGEYERARESAHRTCRQNSLAPETCNVMSCEMRDYQ
jgi:hypothetical protein